MWWIIPLIVGVISAVIGYFLAKSNQPTIHEEVLNELRIDNANLRKDLTKDATKKALFIEKIERLIQDYQDGMLIDSSEVTSDLKNDLLALLKEKQNKELFIEKSEKLIQDYREGRASDADDQSAMPNSYARTYEDADEENDADDMPTNVNHYAYEDSTYDADSYDNSHYGDVAHDGQADTQANDDYNYDDFNALDSAYADDNHSDKATDNVPVVDNYDEFSADDASEIEAYLKEALAHQQQELEENGELAKKQDDDIDLDSPPPELIQK